MAGSSRPLLDSVALPGVVKVEPITTARVLRGPFDYLAPEGAVVGTRLVVPFGRRDVPPADFSDDGHPGAGRVIRWSKVHEPLGSLDDPAVALDHLCWLAFISDDLPSDAVLRAHPRGGDDVSHADFYGASLDHALWFHRPMRVDQWHLYDGWCHAFNRARGLAIGHIFAADGTHTATFAQEFLAREVAAAD